MRALIRGVFLTVVVAACLPPAGKLFEATLSPGDYPLPIALGDQTDLVVAIEPAEPDPAAGVEPLVRPDPKNPHAVILTWLGGACDNDAVLSFRRSGSGFVLHLDVRGKLGFGCTAAGILRSVRIRTSEPIPAESISATGRG